ncbi:hypothetical protein [Gordonia iterans]|uniref:hypothetical protein n=1 Tax=Gordonia iterans TaxID=1004901 RepID=UPI00267893F3|nr:hypothetical protein [Gordonia iterans]
MARRKQSRPPVRGYGLTAWGRAFVAVVESGADHRHLTGARHYFREHHVEGLAIAPGQITAAVRGSQLDPFEVILRPRTVDPATVVELLRAGGNVDALLALARGEQPGALGELVAPTESADVASSCTCPDQAPRCIHVLATAFEVAAQIDKQPTTLLRVMGTDLPDLLALAEDRSAHRSPSNGRDSAGGRHSAGGRSDLDGRADPDGRASLDGRADLDGRVSLDGRAESRPPSPAEPGELAETFYADRARLPAPPTVPRTDALTDLDAGVLRQALRASGAGATQLAEALDDLAELYAALRDLR